MKIKNKTEENIQFKPIVIEITIESEIELKSIWHRLNARGGAIIDDATGELKDSIDFNANSTYDLFDIIDDIAKDMGIMK